MTRFPFIRLMMHVPLEVTMVMDVRYLLDTQRMKPEIANSNVGSIT